MIRLMLHRWYMWRIMRNCRKIGTLTAMHQSCNDGNVRSAVERECDRLTSLNVNLWTKTVQLQERKKAS